MKKLYLIILVLVGFLGGTALAQPSFEIDNTSGDPGGTVTVNFKVTNFTNIVGMQFSINWDPQVLRYNSIGNITNAIRDFDAAAFNTDSKWTDDGSIIVQWFDTGAEPNNLPNGTIIFSIDFDIVGGDGSTTQVTISGEPRDIEIIDNNEDNIGLESSGGTFTASGMGGGATLRLIGSQEEAGTGENVCVEVTTQGFTNINGMQFSLRWDPAFLQYTNVGGFNLNGLTEGSFNPDSVAKGEIVLQWMDPSSNGISLADGTQIFQICFDILGQSGSSTVQFSNTPLAIEIVDGDDNTVAFAKIDGTVSVSGGGGGGSDCNADGFALSIEEEQVDPGTEVCNGVTVKGFTTIASLAGSVEWDPAILSNPSIENINLNGLALGNFNLDQGAEGRLSFVWIEPTTDGISLTDGTKIFDICFDVIGSNGETSTIVFSDILADREVSNADGAIDFNQCDGKVQVGNDNVEISFTSTSPSCAGSSDGSINITVNAGSSPYTYDWTSGGASAGTSEDLSNLTAGTYTVEVTDANGAKFSREIVLSDPDGARVTDANITDATSGDDGAIALTIMGGATPLRFSWSNGQTTRDIAGLSGGTYNLTITDANGCVVDTSFTVGGGELQLGLAAQNISCNGESDGQISATVSGGAGGYTYSWSSGQSTESISGLTAGSYTVTVTDAAGDTQEASVEITEPDVLMVSINTTPSPNDIEGTATAVVGGGTEPFTYAWNDANSSRTRVVIMLPQGPIQVLVTDANGCQESATGTIPGEEGECFTAVPVMSPNNDGRNDFFVLSCIEGLDNEVEVYDRSGRLVFESTNYDNTWAGKDTDGDLLPDGAYFWVVRVRRDGILEQHLGHLTILSTLN